MSQRVDQKLIFALQTNRDADVAPSFQALEGIAFANENRVFAKKRIANLRGVLTRGKTHEEKVCRARRHFAA